MGETEVGGENLTQYEFSLSDMVTVVVRGKNQAEMVVVERAHHEAIAGRWNEYLCMYMGAGNVPIRLWMKEEELARIPLSPFRQAT